MIKQADLEFDLEPGVVQVEYLPRSDDVLPTITHVWWRMVDITDHLTFAELDSLARRLP